MTFGLSVHVTLLTTSSLFVIVLVYSSITGYENQDWLIPSPALPVSVGGDLTPDQTRETLNYFRKFAGLYF